MTTHKKLSARILSMALSVALVCTMLPTTALAAEGDTPLGASSINTVGTIKSFDKLEDRFSPSTGTNAPDHVYSLSVALNKPVEELQLPSELSAMVENTTTKPAEDVKDSGKVEETTTTTAQKNVAVSWNSDKEYKSDVNGQLIYTAVLPEGYTLADGVNLPQIYVMVGRQARATGDAITITVNGSTTAVGGATLQAVVEANGGATAVTSLKITAGEVTAADWEYLKSLTALTTFEIDSAVTDVANIPMSADSNAIFSTSIVSVTVPQEITIGDSVFYECDKLTTASFTKATSIGGMAFNKCTSLTTASFPMATAIGVNAFDGCTSLTTASFPAVTSISSAAFYNCTSLTTASFPAVTSISGAAFYNCTALATLKLPAAPPSVGTGAFADCPTTRALGYVDADGTPLAGPALTNAQAAYKAASDGSTTDEKWYGWTIESDSMTWASLKTAIAKGGTQIITLNGSDFSTENTTGTITIPSGADITIQSKDTQTVHTITRETGHTSEFFTTEGTGKLTLKDVTLDGNGANVTASAALVKVEGGGTFTLQDGATLQNNKSNARGGGGCVLNKSGGTFNMTGGSIKNNSSTGSSGGGVFNGGTFNMSGGAIGGSDADGNSLVSPTSYANGGGVYNEGTMNVSGTAVITGNKRDGSANDVAFGTSSGAPSSPLIKKDSFASGANIGVSGRSTREDWVENAVVLSAGEGQTITAADLSYFTVNSGNYLVLGTNNLIFSTSPPPKYTVTFNANGGTGGTLPTGLTQASAGANVTIPAPSAANCGTKVGFTLNTTKWNTAAAGTGTDVSAGSYTPTTNVTLYAKWTAPIAVTVNGSTTPVGGATLQAVVEANGGATTVTSLKITAGAVTTADWNYLKSLTSLTTFEIDNAVTDVANIPNGTSSASIFPPSIVSVTVPQEITIGNNVFFNCEKLTTASFLKATSIGNRAFSGCIALTTATFPAATIIDVRAFNGCAALTSASFPKAESIGIDAFSYSPALTTASFPVATSIGGYAFYKCAALATLKLPAAPPSVGTGAFAECPTTRALGYLAADGTELTGTASAAAQAAYKAVDDGDTTDEKWYDWAIVPAASTHVPVTGITSVPSTATVGTALTLSGTVAPATATNKTIVWSVKTAGNTGATVSGSTLSTTAAGAVVVTATITNGLTASTNYTQDFDITVNAPKTPANITVTTPPTKTTYTAGETFNKAGMVVTATYIDSTTAAVSGYTFSPTRALATTDTTITISYTENGTTVTTTQAITVSGGGGSGGGGGGSSSGGGTTTPAGGTAGGTNTPGKTVIDNPVGSTGSANPLAEAVKNATAAGKTSATSYVNYTNYTALTVDGLKAINDAAAAAVKDKNVKLSTKLQLDNTVGNVVLSRVTVDPAKLTAVMPDKLGLSVWFDQQKDTQVTAVKDKFERAFSNKLITITFEQKTPLAVNMELALKPDLSELNTKNLHFYSYNPTTNIYTRIAAPAYWVDKNGYSHITAPFGGSIIITDSPLTVK